MLEPYSRSLILDLLRPPDGYRLDAGIGTTYSLDLISLLIVPFAFASIDAANPEDGPRADSLAVLNGLHQYANRLTVFCQEDRICIPRLQYPQLAYLERTVIPCRSPRGGAFHPKVWLLRFERSPEDVCYRMLCLSRNLTFDRSWDTALTLEGPLLQRKNGVAANHPLGDFVKTLPAMACVEPAQDVRDRIAILQDEVRRVDFALPEGFSEYRFWPIGIDGQSRWPFRDAGRRMLVISPFITQSRLKRLAAGSTENLLVSTLPALTAIGGTPEGFTRAYCLNDNARPDEDTDSDDAGDASGYESMPADLHAKCYVADDGATTRVWTGSANATDAAFEKNVEFLVELVGPKRVVGIDTLMVGQKESTRLIDLLQEAPSALDVPEADEVERELVALLDDIRQALLGSHLSAQVKWLEQNDRFDVEVHWSTGCAALASGASISVWPITLPQHSHQRPLVVDAAGPITFTALSFEALTAFYAFEITATRWNRVRREGFVLRLPIDGLPEKRAERLLTLMLSDRNRFVQFLLLLLGDERDSGLFAVGGNKRDDMSEVGASLGFRDEALLESLVRALDRFPDRIDQVARLVEDLAASPDSAAVLPPRFDEIWAPIVELRQRMQNASPGSTS